MIPATVIPASAGTGSLASAGTGSLASAGTGPLACTVPVPTPPPGCHAPSPSNPPPPQRAPAPLRPAPLRPGPLCPDALRNGPLRNGNPRGNPQLAPRCGAKARTTGCPCRAPAMANGRCRMHGGNCRGPSSPKGIARMTKANTKHGRFAAAKRADQRYIRTLIVRTYVLATARRLSSSLPPDMAARLAAGPQELAAPIHPSNLPFLTPQDAMTCTVRTRPLAAGAAARAPRSRRPEPPAPTGRAAERLAARAERAALAPWRQAIAFARAARRAARAARRAARQARAAGRKTRSARRNAVRSEPATSPGGGAGAPPGREPGASPGGEPATSPGREPGASPGGRNALCPPGLPRGEVGPVPVPLSTWAEASPLERELAARAAGLRAGRCGPPAADAAPAPGEESASPGPNAVHSERPPAPKLTRLTPTKAAALRGTSLATVWDSGMRPALAARFGPPVPEPGRLSPQAMSATDPVAAVVRSLMAAQQCLHREPAP